MVGNFSRRCVRASRFSRFRTVAAFLVPCLVAFSGTSAPAKAHRVLHPATIVQTGIASPQADLPVKAALEITPARVRFEETPIGEVSSQMVRLTNTGEDLLQIKRIEGVTTEFSISGQVVPFVIAKGTSADFTVSYRPKSEGHEAARIVIYASEIREPVAIDLVGSAVAPQQELVATVASLDFADVPIGTPVAKQISITNTGNRELRVPAATLTGDSGFSVTEFAGIKLSPGQKADICVSFQATTTGRRQALLRISENLEIQLTAIGVPGSSSVIKLQWDGNPASASGYALYRSADASGPYERIAGSLNAAEYLDSGLAAGHTYYYVVTATEMDDRQGEFSEPISATVPEG
jgi:hypothetical protein